MPYLDAAARTPLGPGVLEAMRPWLDPAGCGNPSSPHGPGRRARAALDRAREQVAASVGAAPRDVVFLSGGTEANNLALRGTWRARPGPGRNRVVVSGLEHPSVARTAAALAAAGAAVTVVPPDAGGRIHPDALAEVLGDDVLLVSVLLVHNETGVIQDVAALAGRAHACGALFHTDAAQAPLRIPVRVGELEADLLTLSSHKLHGPAGAGALVVRGAAGPAPLLTGGPQERGRRAGTEPVAALVGMGEAFAQIETDRESVRAHLEALDADLVAGLGALGGILHGEPGARAPGIVNAAFPGLRGEDLAMALDLAGYAIGLGAACSSGTAEPSASLRAMGLPPAQVTGAFRVSVGRDTTTGDVAGFLAALPGILARLRGGDAGAAA